MFSNSLTQRSLCCNTINALQFQSKVLETLVSVSRINSKTVPQHNVLLLLLVVVVIVVLQ